MTAQIVPTLWLAFSVLSAIASPHFLPLASLPTAGPLPSAVSSLLAPSQTDAERHAAERHTWSQSSAIAPLSILACIFRLQEKSDIMSRYPDTLSTVATQSSDPIQRYRQKSGYYAVHYSQPTDPAGAEFVMADDAGGAIAVFKGEVSERSAQRSGIQGTITPVYSAEGGLAAIPTGQVFVRFAEGVDARDRAPDLEKLGYEIVKVLSFAPQGAWVRAKNGSIPEGLENLRSLEDLAQVEKIEPQMLIERSLR